MVLIAYFARVMTLLQKSEYAPQFMKEEESAVQ